jgi:hypothetical protein
MLLLLLAVVVVAVAVWARRKPRHRDDLPARLVTLAAGWLPPDRKEWADALIAESAAVRGNAARWAYAVAALRMAALPPTRRPEHLVRTAAAATAGAVSLSAPAVVAVPALAPFVTTLAVLLAVYATVHAGRSTPHTTTAAHRTVAFTAVAGITATVAALSAVAVAHPTATTDRTHILPTLLAAALTGYLACALHEPAAHAGPIRYTAVAGALCLAGAATLNTTTGVSPMLSATTIGICLLAATGVAATTGSTAAGRHAGLLTAVLAAPLQLTAVTISLLTARRWSLTTAYDQAAYPRSGFPDVASYLISDALGGHIITGLLIGPLALGALAAVAAPAGARLAHALHVSDMN